MEEILKWLSTYSLPIVFLIGLGTIFLYFLKIWTEKAISNEFDRHKKVLELELERRSSFEEKILVDRYTCIRELHISIGNIVTNIKKFKSGANMEGFIVNTDLVPLTEVFLQLAANKYLISKSFFDILNQQASLAIEYANADNTKLKQIENSYLELSESFNNQMNVMFGLDKIKWKI